MEVPAEVIGTGAAGSLPQMPEVEEEARRRKVDLVLCRRPRRSSLNEGMKGPTPSCT
jgi:hypothetical protein